MKEIFYELIKEASNGKVLIDGEIWPIGFNTIIYENNNSKLSLINDINISTLVIQDELLFFNKLEEYLKFEKEKNRKSLKFYRDIDNNQIKILIAYLFVNATLEDFLNPINLIERNIDFLKDNTFKKFDLEISFDLTNTLFASNLIIKNTNQSILMETPNRIEISLKKGEDVYKLPSISYGIKRNKYGEKECYIYSILGENIDNQFDNSFAKKINRILYKLNKGVLDSESLEYLDYQDGKSNYYPENISDVSMSSVLSLIIFVIMLKKENINIIKGIPFLPLRYLSRSITANNQLDATRKEYLNQRNDSIQKNITDKFIRTFRRVGYHVSDLEFISYPYEFSEYLEMKLGKSRINSNNEIINEVENNISKISK